MSESRVTLAQIAARAGVHVTTVSMALRNHPRLPPETREKLQRLAQQMGYVPDPALRALVAYRTRATVRRHAPTLAYVTNWSTRWGWKKVTGHQQFFTGAENQARELGFRLEHFWLREAGMTPARLGQVLHTRGIRGLVIASHRAVLSDQLPLDWRHFSGVKIDYFPHEPALHNVTNNQTSIIRLALRKLRAAGYQRPGFVMHRRWDHAVDQAWTAGFLCEQLAWAESERVPMHVFPALEPEAAWINDDRADALAEPRAFTEWYGKYRPDVIVSKAAFVLPLLRRMGQRVPRDVAFVDLFLENPDGATAGVEQNHLTVGAQAIEILAGQLQHNKFGVPTIPTTTYVEGTWHDGASCPALVAS